MSEAQVAVHALSRAAEAVRQINASCVRDAHRGAAPNAATAQSTPSLAHVQNEIAEILRVEHDFARLVGRMLELVERVHHTAVTESRREFADYMDACARQIRACSG